MVKATANKIIIRGNLVGKPGDSNSLFTSICANRVAKMSVIDNRRKPGAKIEVIHNQKETLCASKDGTFERENCSLRRSTALTAGTLRVFELRGSTHDLYTEQVR